MPDHLREKLLRQTDNNNNENNNTNKKDGDSKKKAENQFYNLIVRSTLISRILIISSFSAV
jgi:hypothetical protein